MEQALDEELVDEQDVGRGSVEGDEPDHRLGCRPLGDRDVVLPGHVLVDVELVGLQGGEGLAGVVRDLEGNLLLVHGTGDDNVHYQGSERLIDEFVRHNKKFDFLPYPNRAHSISEREGTRLHLHSTMSDYFDEHPVERVPSWKTGWTRRRGVFETA